MVIQLQTQLIMQVFIAGIPYAQTRARHVIKEDGTQQVYSSASEGLKRWRGALEQGLLKARRELALEPMTGVLCVDMVFMLPVKEKSRWGELAPVKPDKDNLEKAVLDVMGDCKFFAVGDQQVAAGGPIKLWCRRGEGGVLIRVARARVKKNATSSGEAGGIVDWLAQGKALQP